MKQPGDPMSENPVILHQYISNPTTQQIIAYELWRQQQTVKKKNANYSNELFTLEIEYAWKQSNSIAEKKFQSI